jgi:protein-S-isoprenylcysteine O-methyltransferase Ste14
MRSRAGLAALACLLVLAGALLVDAQVAEDAVGTAFAITVLTSLVPAALAGFALLLRKWIGREMPRPDVHPHAPPPPPPTAL